MELADLIDALGKCLDRYAVAAHSEKTLKRRSAMITFLHYCSIYLLEPTVQPAVLACANYGDHYDLFVKAKLQLKDAGFEPPTRALIDELLSDAIHTLEEPLDDIERLFSAGEWASANLRALAALQNVFDWTPASRLRIYVYAATGEWLAEGLLGNQRWHLLDSLGNCLEEMQ